MGTYSNRSRYTTVLKQSDITIKKTWEKIEELNNISLENWSLDNWVIWSDYLCRHHDNWISHARYEEKRQHRIDTDAEFKEHRKETKKANAESKFRARKRKSEQLRNAHVAWADNKKIDAIYDAAQVLSILNNEKLEVDHIIPLKATRNGIWIACGLHNEHNLQVVTALENNKKRANIDYIIEAVF